MFKQLTPKQKVRCVLPLASNPCAPYGAQGLDASILIWHRYQQQPVERFLNDFQTTLSIVDWSHDGNILLAGSMTGEVLAWRFSTGERLLANRHARSYAPIVGVSWSPGGYYLVAITKERIIQVWQVETRQCIGVLPCFHRPTCLTWSFDGSGFRTNDGLVWNALEGSLV